MGTQWLTKPYAPFQALETLGSLKRCLFVGDRPTSFGETPMNEHRSGALFLSAYSKI